MVIWKSVFLNFANKHIVFCWVPSHVSTRGNEKANSAAKSALESPCAKVCVPYSDFKHKINHYNVYTWAICLEWCGCEQASFCQASPRRSAVILQAIVLDLSTLATHIWPIHTSWRKILHLNVVSVKCILIVHHNHLARTRIHIFGRDVSVLFKILINIIVIIYFAQLFTLFNFLYFFYITLWMFNVIFYLTFNTQ